MAKYAYLQVTRPDEIRVLTLYPGTEKDLEGSISHIELPPYISPSPSFSTNTRAQDAKVFRNTRRLLDIFESQSQRSNQSADSADSGGNFWRWMLLEVRKDSVRRSIHGRLVL